MNDVIKVTCARNLVMHNVMMKKIKELIISVLPEILIVIVAILMVLTIDTK